MPVDADRLKLLYKISKAYYEDKLTYEQIGKRFGFSRMKVSRLLEQARDERIVQIIITPPKNLNAELERKMEAKFGLDEAVIVSPSGYDEPQVVAEALGPATADYLLRYLQGNEVIGLAWGYTLLSVVDAIPATKKPGIRVVSTTGGLGRLEDETYGADLVRRMAQAFGGKPFTIPAPGIIRSREVYSALMGAPQVAEALALAEEADVALVGIGAPTPGSVVRRTGILTDQELEQLKECGAVGDIVLRYLDANGRPIEHEINDRIIGLHLHHVKEIPRVIAAAGGTEKFEVIRAVLRGKYIDVLITDDRTAARLLEDTEA